jgi:hypothetical protein
MSKNHYIAGLPEWADDETAKDAAEAVLAMQGNEPSTPLVEQLPENKRAATREQKSSPENLLLMAIFGDVPASKTAIQPSFDGSRGHQRKKINPAGRTHRTEEQAKARLADLAVIPIGSVHRASVPYRLAKNTSNLCFVCAVLVEAPGVVDGDNVRIVAHIHGRSYGRVFAAKGEVCI